MKSILLTASLLALVSTSAKAEECSMTKDQFNQIKLEMFYSKVSSIVDCKADPVTETKFGDIRTAMYRYRSAEGGSDIVLMFQNRQLVAKQAGGSF